MKRNVQKLKGFRDFLPGEKGVRDFIVKKIKKVFSNFAFKPIETPTLEYASLLLGKYGKEADKLIYKFEDRGGRQVALRYDQTVPTTRFLLEYKEKLPKYFRRYQIQNVFRADKPQKGRYREFTQCDIDIFGSKSSIADAEIIACTYFVFKEIGFKRINIKLNDRQILFEKLNEYANDKLSVASIIQTIDKLDKIGKEKIIEELVRKGLTKKKAEAAFSSISKSLPSKNLQKIINYSLSLGVSEETLLFTPTLARGLDYYTGMIVEVSLPDYDSSSCAGGGRYDNLINQLSGNNLPAVGIAFGFDRIIEAVKKLKIKSPLSKTQVLVTVFNKELIGNSLKIASYLRNNNIKTEVYPVPDKLQKQVKYASKIEADYVVIIGPEEKEKNMIRLKNMKTREQKVVNSKDGVKEIQNT